MWLVAGATEDAEGLRPRLIELHQNPAVVLGSSLSLAEWKASYLTSLSPLSSDLPPNAGVLSLQVRDGSPNSTLVLRVRHLFERGAHPIYSQPVTLDPAELFQQYWVLDDVQLMSLSLQQDAATAAQRRQWPIESGAQRNSPRAPGEARKPQDGVTLGPMEIRTWTFVADPATER